MFVIALRKKLQLEVEKKCRGTNIVPAALYQRYGRTLQSKKAEKKWR